MSTNSLPKAHQAALQAAQHTAHLRAQLQSGVKALETTLQAANAAGAVVPQSLQDSAASTVRHSKDALEALWPGWQNTFRSL